MSNFTLSPLCSCSCLSLPRVMNFLLSHLVVACLGAFGMLKANVVNWKKCMLCCQLIYCQLKTTCKYITPRRFPSVETFHFGWCSDLCQLTTFQEPWFLSIEKNYHIISHRHTVLHIKYCTFYFSTIRWSLIRLCGVYSTDQLELGPLYVTTVAGKRILFCISFHILLYILFHILFYILLSILF